MANPNKVGLVIGALNTDVERRPIAATPLGGVRKICGQSEGENGSLPEEDVRKLHGICKEFVPLSSWWFD